MKAGDTEQNKGKRGFAALSSLVSDVDTSSPPAAKHEQQAMDSSETSSSAERPKALENAQPEPQPKQQQFCQAPLQPSSGSSAGKWLFGIAVVIGGGWLLSEAYKNSLSSVPSYSQTPSYSPPVGNTAPSYSATSARPQVPARPDEAKPPVGRDLVFTTAQIRYCLAEDIRLDGTKSALNNYSDSDVDRVNAMVADFNSRCGSFRYRSGALESAHRDIEPYRSQLQVEGRSRLARSSSNDSLSVPAATYPAQTAVAQTSSLSKFAHNSSTDSQSVPASSQPFPDSKVKSVQQKLKELGYNAGPADGVMGRATRAAILDFQQDQGLTVTGVADHVFLLQLRQASPRQPLKGRSANKSVQLSPAESESLEAACSNDKYLNGPAAYRACSERQKAAAVAGVRRPNMDALSPAEHQSIEAACSTDKYLNGPAAYNRCLNNQLSALSGKGAKRPNLSRLSSPEKESIEAACSTDKYLNGPAAYNRCLNSQLAALERQGTRPDLSRISSTERNSIEAACSTDKYLNGPAVYNHCLSQQLLRLIN